jgi:hypothetical protein
MLLHPLPDFLFENKWEDRWAGTYNSRYICFSFLLSSVSSGFFDYTLGFFLFSDFFVSGFRSVCETLNIF